MINFRTNYKNKKNPVFVIENDVFSLTINSLAFCSGNLCNFAVSKSKT